MVQNRLRASEPISKTRYCKTASRGVSTSAPADRYGVSVTTVYNIRDAFRGRRALTAEAVKESMTMPSADPADLPDDIEGLKRGCLELEMDNAILRQTIGILKKTQASTHRS